MTTLLLFIIGGVRRSAERRITCPCGWWAEVGGEEVEGIWFPEVPEVVCEECGERVSTEEGEE